MTRDGRCTLHCALFQDATTGYRGSGPARLRAGPVTSLPGRYGPGRSHPQPPWPS